MKKLLTVLLLLVFCAAAACAAMSDEDFVTLCGKEGAAPQLLAALNDGANPNARDGKSTALGEACFYADREGMNDVVAALLDKGADVNATCDSDNETPLMRAAEECSFENVKRMVEMGANVNAVSEGGKTPLSAARTAEIAQLLLDRGAKMDDGTLIRASQWPDRPDVVELLIKNGAKKDVASNRGWTAMTWAASDGCAGAIKVLAAHGLDPNVRAKNGETPLIVLIRKAHTVEAAAALIDCGADVNARDEEGFSALYYAVKKYVTADMALFLLDRGAQAVEPGSEVYSFYDMLVRGKSRATVMRDAAERQKLIDRIHPVKK